MAPQNTPTPKELTRTLFKEKDSNKQGCRMFECVLCGTNCAKPNGAGYTNLASHLTIRHRDCYMTEYLKRSKSSGSMDKFVVVGEAARNLFGWLEYTIMGNHPISIVDDPLTRRYSRLKPRPTFMKYMTGVEDMVVERIRMLMNGRRFGLMFDGWTESGTHYVAVVAIVEPDDIHKQGEMFLLGFSPYEDEAEQGTGSLIEYVDFLLDKYSINSKNQLRFIVCDHASVNVSFASLTDVPFVGCAGHRLQLAVKSLLHPHETLLSTVQDTMSKWSRSTKFRHFLRVIGAKMPVLRNATRWSSTYRMVKRALEIDEKITRRSKELWPFKLSAVNVKILKSVYEKLRCFESVSRSLQKRDSNLLTARVLFDHVLAKYSECATYLDPTANVVKSPDFENAVVKILRGNEKKLTKQEEQCMSGFKRHEKQSPPKKLSFAQQALQSLSPVSSYVSLHWIPSTSCEVERLFSAAGRLLTDLRKAMHPSTLESLLLLQFNRTLWDEDMVQIVHDKMNKPRVEVQQSMDTYLENESSEEEDDDMTL